MADVAESPAHTIQKTEQEKVNMMKSIDEEREKDGDTFLFHFYLTM